ncbi:MAG: hypothetical protein FWC47_02735 [Oscillospiraceae bacterium]|nr:hypothetical protein [Oscillospiraceae bacterium]
MGNYIWNSAQNINTFFDELEKTAYKNIPFDNSFSIKRISYDKFRIEYHKSPIQNFFKRFLECKIETESNGLKIISKFHLGTSSILFLTIWFMIYAFFSAGIIWDLSRYHSLVISIFTILILTKVFAFSVIILLNILKGESEKKILNLMNDLCLFR